MTLTILVALLAGWFKVWNYSHFHIPYGQDCVLDSSYCTSGTHSILLDCKYASNHFPAAPPLNPSCCPSPHRTHTQDLCSIPVCRSSNIHHFAAISCPPLYPAAPLPTHHTHTGSELHPGLHARIQACLSHRPGGSPGLASLQVRGFQRSRSRSRSRS